MARKLYLLLEFLGLFAGVPALLAMRVLPVHPIPVLIGVAALQSVWLWRDEQFDTKWLVNQEGALRHWRGVAVRCLCLVTLLGACVTLLAPALLFHLVEKAPLVWAVLMVLYPLYSVYPQELVYRAFLFHRYAELFPRQWLVLASASAFGFAHIVMGNWLSIAMSLLGGVLFARTYQKSKSLLLVSAEHAAFGNFIFTIGLGEYFLSRI